MPITTRDTFRTSQLMTAQTAGTDGVWADVRDIRTFSIHILNLSGSDVVEVRVSCEASRPSNSAHSVQYGVSITSDRIVSSNDNRFRWLKIRKSTGGGSATDAFLLGSFV